MYALKNPTGKPSDKAFQFAVSLIEQTTVGKPAVRLDLFAKLAGFNAGQVSGLIDTLKMAANEQKKSAPAPTLPAEMVPGTYMVDGEAYALKISKSGYPYIMQNGIYLGAKGEAAKIIDAIKADPKGCAVAYGKATGVCGVCHKTLTDPKSIAAGIGPVCAAKY